jgi:hypothetical protein
MRFEPGVSLRSTPGFMLAPAPRADTKLTLDEQLRNCFARSEEGLSESRPEAAIFGGGF